MNLVTDQRPDLAPRSPVNPDNRLTGLPFHSMSLSGVEPLTSRLSGHSN